MKQINSYISNREPNVKCESLWIKPLADGFALYLLDGGFWKPLKVVNDQQTTAPGDDKERMYIQVTDIKALTTKQCDALNVGDQVLKKTGTQMHLYTVTYKDETNGGMCLSYIDAENAETVAYDRTNGEWSWTDTTITPLKGE